MSEGAGSGGSRERLPARRLPLLYFAFAYLSLAWACATLALDPHSVAGFFYHARMLAVVHLITLGWISCSIVGALFIVAPMALRVPFPTRRADYVTFAALAVGISGMVSHFWIDETSGMWMSAALVLLGFGHAAGRFLGRLPDSPVPWAIKLHFRLAFFNLGVAAIVGLLLGINKTWPFLPGYVMTNVYAHAHLATVGWATMLVMAVGYRLLPMLLPAAMPSGAGLGVGALLLEAGVLGVFVCLWLQSGWVALFAALVAGGILVFLGHVVWMMRNRRTPPRALPRPDVGVWHAGQALIYLALSTLLGLALAATPAAGWKLQAAMAYGALALLGFLGQLVVGVSHRLLPPYYWMQSFAQSGFVSTPPSPHALIPRWSQLAIFVLWTLGVPGLAAGLTFDQIAVTRAAGMLLLAAVLLGGATQWHALRRSRSGLSRKPA